MTMLNPKPGPPTEPSAPEVKPKTAWDRLLTTTPVVMTVVATLLAGLSSSEMTKAQYFRSLAAQSQSKVGDQWAFFQAKRARGSNHVLTAKLLRAMTDARDVDAAALQASAEHVLRQLRFGQKKAEELAASNEKLGGKSDSKALAAATDALVRVLQTETAKAEALKIGLAETLNDQDVQKALAVLTAEVPAESTRKPVAGNEAPNIDAALAAIAGRKTEAETESLIAPIHLAALQQSIGETENSATSFDQTCKPVTRALARVDKLLAEEVSLARSYSRAVAAVRDVSDRSAGNEAPAETQRAILPLVENSGRLQASVTELNNSFTAASLRYDAWRYDHEAADNQRAAGLYEIQVRKHSWTAEWHRKRSAYFFYGMLAAQAGVTIATLALAVKLRSLLWGLASFAGLVAVGIAAYVYWYV